MAQAIPQEYHEWFRRKVFAHVATLMPDGSPQVTPVWVDFDGTHVLINSAAGRQKDKNVRQRPDVALAIGHPDDPYQFIQVRGRVVEITEEGAEEHIDQLAQRYLGVERYPGRQPGEKRLIYKIQPERVTVKQ